MIRLTRRERWLAVGLAVLITTWMLFTFTIRPAVERMKTLNRVIPESQRQLQQLRTKNAQYLALQARLDNYKNRAISKEKGVELPAFLESITKQSGLAEKIATMRQEVLPLDSNYYEMVAELRLENLTLKQLVEFLLKIKTSEHLLRIKSLYAKKNVANPNLLDVMIQISTLKPNKTT